MAGLRWWNRLKCDGEIGCFYSSANIELPTAPVATVIAQLEPPKGKPGFEKFDFEGRLQ